MQNLTYLHRNFDPKHQLISKLNDYISKAEATRKNLYLKHALALSTSDMDKAKELALEIAEIGGKIRAYTQCVNLTAVKL